MNVKLSSKKLGLLALCCIVFTIGLSVSLEMKKTPKAITIESHSSIPFAHAQDNEGCATCHSTPITGGCASCHADPPTTLDNGILFPHHDRDEGGPLDTCSDSSCHDAGSDIRFVDTPNASHSYCNICHSGDMSHG